MKTIQIACVVEGQGDREAVPVVIRRIVARLDPSLIVQISFPMESGRKYVETIDQPTLAAAFDLEMARRADSFDKCYREIVRLVGEMQKRGESGSV